MARAFINLWQGISRSYRPPVMYVGTIKTIPSSEVQRVAEGQSVERLSMEWDESERSFVRELEGNGWAVVPEGVVEQIEALDHSTGDLLVMWRAPCQRLPKG